MINSNSWIKGVADTKSHLEEQQIGKGDFVAVQAEKRGYDIGKITMIWNFLWPNAGQHISATTMSLQ